MIDVPLENIVKVWKEGLFMKKVCISVKENSEQKDYKFGVLSNGGWLETLQDTLEEFKNQ